MKKATMRLGPTAIFIPSILISVEAACKKDACYNDVAVARAGSPHLARRLADCSSILRTVVEDDLTRTTTSYTTAFTATTLDSTVTTETTTSKIDYFSAANRRRQSPELSELSPLEARDKIIIKGAKPAYAANCKSSQDYGKSFH